MACRGDSAEESAVEQYGADPDGKERVYLVGVMKKGERRDKFSYSVQESLEELARLADTAGLEAGSAQRPEYIITCYQQCTHP